jgi:hypothetical protein
MRYSSIVIIFILLFQPESSAQITPGARQVSLSHSDIALSNDVFSIFNNPAGLAQMNWREIGIYYSFAPFGVKELANGFASYHEPTSLGSFGAGFMTYGFELYRENKFAISYANNFSNRLFFGITAIYQSLSIQNYGNDYAINFIFGGMYYLQNNLRLGFSIENPTRSTYGDEDNQIPIVFNSGLSYDLIDELSINFAVQKEIDYNASVRMGIEYLIIKYLNLRIGINNEPSTFSAGIGINYSFIQLDYATFTHQDLGLTHQAGLIIQFGGPAPRRVKINKYLKLDTD